MYSQRWNTLWQIPTMELWMVKLMQLANMEKLTTLIKENTLSSFVTWKTPLDFFAWKWKKWNFKFGIWWLALFMMIEILCSIVNFIVKGYYILYLNLICTKSEVFLSLPSLSFPFPFPPNLVSFLTFFCLLLFFAVFLYFIPCWNLIKFYKKNEITFLIKNSYGQFKVWNW